MDKFYETINKALTSSTSEHLIVMGDFNAQIGTMQDGEDSVFGKFGHGKRSPHGTNLIQFASENNLKITNTMFERKKHRKWTWKTPNNKHFNEIDYILCNKPKQIVKFDVIKPNFYTDHRMVRCELNVKSERRFKAKKLINLRSIPELSDDQKETLKSRFSLVSQTGTDIQTQYNTIQENISHTLKEFTQIQQKRGREISEATEKLLQKRKNLYKQERTRENRREITNISKEINRNITKDKKQHRKEVIERFITKSGAIKKAFKELNYKKEWTSNLQTKNGTKISKRPDILGEATKFYENLYATNETLNSKNYEKNITDGVRTIPSLLKCEVEYAIKSQKDDKSPGDDNINNEILKALLEPILTPLQTLFDNILKEGHTPEEWSKSTTILLHKKGDRKDLGNYRPISLMSNIYKVFSKILLNRITPALEENQPKEQAGFRKNYSTIDHIQVVSTLISRCREYNVTMYVCFIDFTKAFDSLDHSAIWQALEQQGVEKGYIEVLHSIYSRCSSKIRMETDGQEFPIKRGVRQGDPISPKIFCSVLEMIFRNLDWQYQGIVVNGEHLSHLRFADDIVIFADSPQNLENMINELARESKRVGLALNASKTKVMTNGEQIPIIIDQNIVEYVNEYTYLGQSIAFEDLTEKEIGRRIQIAWKKYWGLKEVMKNKDIDIGIKRKLYDVAILPCLIYGCQTWALRKEDETKLAVCQRKMERSMLGIKLSDKIDNKTIRQKTKLRDIVKTVRTLKWNWAGHVCRMNNERWTKKVVEWIPRANKRSRGRPYRRWEDAFTQKHGRIWMRLARERKLWTTLGEAYVDEATNYKTDMDNIDET